MNGDDLEASADAIERSSAKMDRATWQKLFGLTAKQPWLEPRQSELLDLIELCADLDQQTLVCDLLDRFDYVSSDALQGFVQCVAEHICDVRECKPSSTKFGCVNKSKYSDSSEYVLYLLKAAFGERDGWNTAHFYSHLGEVVDAAATGDQIILIEEFVGSGTTARKAVSWVREKLAARAVDADVSMYAIAAMQHARERIELVAGPLEACIWMKKGISSYYRGVELQRAVELMTQLEAQLDAKADNRYLKDHRFGYKRTEALYYAQNLNTPNNVFPIFWWKYLNGAVRRRPLLTRVS